MNLLKKFKEKFDEEIINWLEKKIKQAEKIDKTSSLLVKIIKEFIENGGKRIRPALFYYAYKTYSNKNLNQVFQLSFVFELFHTFALIHDDIIDNSNLRRGKPTVHKKYDLSTAILAGDLALTFADEIFFDLIKNKKAINEYNRFKQEVLLGEYLDYKKINDIKKIMSLKTAYYSFVRPITIGLHLANINSKEISRWKKILTQIGIVFQLKDDFIGTFGNEKEIGKSVTSDFIEGKNTLIIQYFKKIANKEELDKFKRFFGKKEVKKEDFIWYLDKLKEKKVDKKIENIVNLRCQKIKTYLKLNFKECLLKDVLNEIILLLQ